MPNNDYANEPNQSRSEDIIQSILDNTEYDEAARSRIEYLLIELKNAIEGGGGGGGVTSYSPLTEKPKIDNHTLQAGNNTSSDLGLQTKIDSDHKLSADNIDDTNSTNKFNVKSDWNAASGATSEILNKPTLGTSSAKNVPASGNAATGEVVLGSDTRLTDARNAKDVYNWAKQENKPSYSYSEIQNTPTIPDELADLADDSTHRTVTDTEKTTWSGKQNALTFDDAPTSNSNNPVKSGGIYTALSAKQNTLSEAQMAAVNSGATADKINKIAVNENNISWNTQNGVSNVLPLNTVYKRGVHADVTEPSKIHFYGTPDSSGTLSGLTKRMTLKEGTYTITVNTDFNTSLNTDIYLYDMTSSDTIMTIETSGTYEFTANPAHEYLYAFFFNQGVAVDFNYQVTVRPKNSPDVGFQPYALSNVELTAKEQVNENNILSAYGGIVGKNVAKENDFTATLNKTVYCNPITGAIHISAASVSSTDTDSSICRFILYYTDGTDSSTNYSFTRGSNISLDINIGSKIIERIVIYASDNYAHSTGDTVTVSDLMICTQADYAADPTYQPYALSNVELTAKEQVNESNILLKADKISFGFSGNPNPAVYEKDWDFVPDGIYLLAYICSQDASTRRGVSVYMFTKYTTNHIVLFTPVAEASGAIITSCVASGSAEAETITFTLAQRGFHTATAIQMVAF